MAPAKKKAKAAPAKAAPAKSGNKGGGAYLFALVGLIVLGLMIFAAPALLLFAVGVIPAMVAYVVDREPGRNATLAVAAANFAGVAPFIFELLVKGPTMDRALGMLTDVFVIAVCSGRRASAGCWSWGCPGSRRSTSKLKSDRCAASRNGSSRSGASRSRHPPR